MKLLTMHKRAFERIVSSLDARIFYGKYIFAGIVNNLSEEGMFISTGMYFPVGSVLEIIIRLKGKCLTLPGRVRRTVITDDVYEGNGNNGVGVKLLDVPPDYIEFINGL